MRIFRESVRAASYPAAIMIGLLGWIRMLRMRSMLCAAEGKLQERMVATYSSFLK